MFPFPLALAAQTPALPATEVSLSLKASRVPVVLEALGRQTKTTLRARPDMADEIVFVSATRLPAAEVMNALALATSGQWQPDSDGAWTLIPDAARRGAEERDAIQRRLGDYRQALEKMTKEPEKGAVPDAMSGPRGPGERVMAQILLNADLAPVARGERLVFSTDPTPMQRPLPPGAVQLLRGFASAEDARRQKLAAETDGKREKALAQLPPEVKAMMELFAPNETRPIGRVAKALLIVQEGAVMMMGTEARLRFFDASGKMTLEKTLNLGDGAMMRIARGMATAKPAADKGPKIPVSPDTKKFEEAFPMSGGLAGMATPRMPKAEPEFMKRLRRPDLEDPLSFGATDVLRAYAAAKKAPVVAVLPDGLSDGRVIGPTSFPTLAAFGETFQGDAASLRATRTPAGVWVITPAHPFAAREARIRRTDLAEVIRQADEDGTVSLEAASRFALRNPSPVKNWFGPIAGYLGLAPGLVTMATAVSPVGWETLRFWGQLSPTLRATEDVAVVNVTALPPDARTTLREMLYSGSLPVTALGERPPMLMEAMMSRMMPLQNNDLGSEPTELMPRGVPAQAQMELRVEKEPAFEMSISGQRATMGLDDLAFLRMIMDTMKDADRSGMMAMMGVEMDKMRQGTRNAITMRFLIAPQKVAVTGLADDRVPKDAATVSLAKMPSDLDASLQDRIARIKASPFGKVMDAVTAMMKMAGGRQAKP